MCAWESSVKNFNTEDLDETPLYHTQDTPSANKVNEQYLDEIPFCRHLGIPVCDSPEEKSINKQLDKRAQCQPLLKHQCVSELKSPNIIPNTGTNSNTPNV